MLRTCYPRSGRRPPTQVGDLSPKGRVAEGNDNMDSTIIKINSDVPSANADATFRRKVANLRSPTRSVINLIDKPDR
jgi:hypothetical protein